MRGQVAVGDGLWLGSEPALHWLLHLKDEGGTLSGLCRLEGDTCAGGMRKAALRAAEPGGSPCHRGSGPRNSDPGQGWGLARPRFPWWGGVATVLTPRDVEEGG